MAIKILDSSSGFCHRGLKMVEWSFGTLVSLEMDEMLFHKPFYNPLFRRWNI